MLPYADDLSGGVLLRSLETKEIPQMSVDASESDSFHTCPSSQSKQEQETNELRQESPEDKILLIRQRERGVSLPVLMKINCDDLPIRLSTSTPTDAPVYSTIPVDLSSLNGSDADEERRQREPSWLISRTAAAPDEDRKYLF